MKLSIFHYHFLPGGVSSVVAQAIKALQHGRFQEFVLVSGEPGPMQDDASISLRVHHIPELAYLEKPLHDETRYQRLRQALEELKGSIWWVHNYHLGKNPLFTRALIEFLSQNLDQVALLHIHDFPEESRFGLLQQLIDLCGTAAYPILPHVRYITINSRDYRNMQQNGIPASHLFLLENPVLPFSQPPSAPKAAIKKRLQQNFATDFPAFQKDAPLWLYPVRSIRRKNILEAGLLAKHLPFNLIVTLPGVSETEKAYSTLIRQAFYSGWIPGIWGIGATPQAFHDLVAASDGIISSSVQEGFGYQFINARLWNKALVARKIPVLEDFIPLFHQHPHHVYSSLLVPLSTVERRTLITAYQRHIQEIVQGSSFVSGETALAELDLLATSPSWDFSLLSVEQQLDSLRRLPSKDFLDLNPTIFPLPQTLADPIAWSEKAFSMEVFAQNFSAITADAMKEKSAGHMRLLMREVFTGLSDFRLLFS